MHAGITRVSFPPNQADKVIADLKGRVADEHKKLKSQGLRDAIFVINREAGEAIGIAIWDDRNKLQDVEKHTTRSNPDAVRDPNRAPSEYNKIRAQAVRDEKGSIESSDWYEVVVRI
jgi:hypothetical protein